MELKLHHVNYSTKDVGAVAEFYRSLFEYEARAKLRRCADHVAGL